MASSQRALSLLKSYQAPGWASKIRVAPKNYIEVMGFFIIDFYQIIYCEKSVQKLYLLQYWYKMQICF